MSFTVPNAADASHEAQARLFSQDLQILRDGSRATGVVSGCAVTAQGTPDMTVAVAAGRAIVAGALVTVAAGNVTITTANGSNPRIDLVVVNDAGTKSAVAGAAAASPVPPSIPGDSAVLAAVYVPAAASAITSAEIVSKRVPEVYPPFPHYVAGRYYPLLPAPYGKLETASHPNNEIKFLPFYCVGLTIDRLAIRCTNAGNTNAVARLGIYANRADFDAPGDLVVEAGTALVDTTGDKEISFTATAIPDGLNWAATCVQEAASTTPSFRGLFAALTFMSNSGLSNFDAYIGFHQTGVSGALPSTATPSFGTNLIAALRARAA